MRQKSGLNLGVLLGRTLENKTFELLSIESWNSQCRKLLVRQLFGPNLEILRGGKPSKLASWVEPLKIKLLNCSA